MSFTLRPNGPRWTGSMDTAVLEVSCEGVEVDVGGWVRWVGACGGVQESGH